jgi:5-formyltetrahydrofolate cyclo-ligase
LILAVGTKQRNKPAAGRIYYQVLTKAIIRQEFLKKRHSLSPETVVEANAFIRKNTQDLLENFTFETIHCFLPQRNTNEVDTWQILDSLPRLVKIAVPYIIPGTRQMEHYILTKETILTENRWGIPEPDPKTNSPIHPQLVDAVLLPLLAFDKRGYRVGYGGGYYDRFLDTCRSDTLKIGLSFFDAVEAIADIDSYDIRMDFCVTPDKVWTW